MQKIPNNSQSSPAHERKRPYKYNDCSISFEKKHNLNEHIAATHKGIKHYALNPIIKAEKILPKIFLDITHQFHFGQHILVSKN